MTNHLSVTGLKQVKIKPLYNLQQQDNTDILHPDNLKLQIASKDHFVSVAYAFNLTRIKVNLSHAQFTRLF